jgi:phosphate transport system substrate-binding protein
MSSIRRLLWIRRRLVVIAAVLCCSVLALGPSWAGAATNYAPIAGAGSTWSQNAISQWITDVHQFGMRVSYAGTGSSDGRQEFLNGTVDFAASDIPFQTHPEDGSAPEHPPAGSYAYIPVTAGGTTFMYNLVINGRRVTKLRLSGSVLAGIFTGTITNWNDPAIRADNPGLTMPNRRIVPVVRSDGSGSTAQFSLWFINQYPAQWRAYCARTGRGSACGETSYYPTVPGMIAQSGDLGVAGYISQNYAQGAIGYVQYSYALNAGFPVALMLNAAGYYTEPTPQDVAVSLLRAQVDTTDVNDPSRYLTQDLSGVYSDPDPRTYPLSSYSYMIIPTRYQGQFTATSNKGVTLGAFLYYGMCQGQQESASLGYSPMPINLVEDSFNQIRKIPGVVVQNINIRSCNNPTFSPSGANLLAQTAPFPPACDKKGPTQCSAGTGGAAKVSTPVNTGGSGSGSNSGSGTAGNAGSSSGGAGSSSAGSSAGKVVAAGLAGKGAGRTGSTAANPTACDPATQECGAIANGTDTNGSGQPVAISATLPPDRGWTSTQTLMLLAILLLVALIVVPGLVARSLKRRPE